MNMDLQRITERTEAITPTTDAPTLIEILGTVADYRKALKECEDRAWAALEELVKANGPITYGHTKYYIGTVTKDKCRNTRAAVEAVMIAAGGDIDTFNDVLSVNAFKYAAARKLLGPEYEKHFETVVEDELKEGKSVPKKELKAADTRFVK